MHNFNLHCMFSRTIIWQARSRFILNILALLSLIDVKVPYLFLYGWSVTGSAIHRHDPIAMNVYHTLRETQAVIRHNAFP